MPHYATDARNANKVRAQTASTGSKKSFESEREKEVGGGGRKNINTHLLVIITSATNGGRPRRRSEESEPRNKGPSDWFGHAARRFPCP
ncbi:mCG141058 [Anopheles sinensis]|uniref:MCG141058 n=1 Tax=Anopheles sinensis TaxID=74873 RepID=A0A084WKC6_ANOSI|nr:mCG141058 [Anopheles sinensis]